MNVTELSPELKINWAVRNRSYTNKTCLRRFTRSRLYLQQRFVLL